MEQMSEQNESRQPKVKLFREKTLEAVESPEALNNYLKVTSPGVWAVMAAILLVLIGGIIWGIFGRIDTRLNMAVQADGTGAVVYVPYEQAENVIAAGRVNVEGQDYSLRTEGDAQILTITGDTNPFLRVAGNLAAGDMVVAIDLEAEGLKEGIYVGSALTESLQPISLLLQ